ncbi:DUF6531 domain-containing protein [Streptomyces sp. SID3343]|uniref:DUF6531 domain-containing protein n=1 Tax=Streptomyces sp. SID3343 TaxID=2690260 RepID=UPI00136889C4|nr:DUF6531 domain-containing protein [Streptomyces sp. SID3343]MYW00593.1 hypothetical protein [Streptomyces sp. SID3343]
MKETRVRRAKKRSDRFDNTAARTGVLSVFTALALVAALTPFQASATPEVPVAAKPAWGHGTPQPLPPAPKGVTKPVPNIPRGSNVAARDGRGGGDQPFTMVDWDAGDVPWHTYQSYRLSDSIVAKVDVSTGNLMIAGTDLDIAGIGQRLRATRTYNSFWTTDQRGLGSQLLGPQRSIHEWTGSVDIQGESGDTIRFDKNPDGTFTTPAGYKADLVKDNAGVYTLTWRADGRKETFTAAAGLTSITERNGGTVTITRPTYKEFKATDTRSGRWIELRTADSGPTWQNYKLVDNTGRTTTYTTWTTPPPAAESRPD